MRLNLYFPDEDLQVSSMIGASKSGSGLLRELVRRECSRLILAYGELARGHSHQEILGLVGEQIECGSCDNSSPHVATLADGAGEMGAGRDLVPYLRWLRGQYEAVHGQRSEVACG